MLGTPVAVADADADVTKKILMLQGAQCSVSFIQ